MIAYYGKCCKTAIFKQDIKLQVSHHLNPKISTGKFVAVNLS